MVNKLLTFIQIYFHLVFCIGAWFKQILLCSIFFFRICALFAICTAWAFFKKKQPKTDGLLLSLFYLRIFYTAFIMNQFQNELQNNLKIKNIKHKHTNLKSYYMKYLPHDLLKDKLFQRSPQSQVLQVEIRAFWVTFPVNKSLGAFFTVRFQHDRFSALCIGAPTHHHHFHVRGERR